jgi:hypothetical protein
LPSAILVHADKSWHQNSAHLPFGATYHTWFPSTWAQQILGANMNTAFLEHLYNCIHTPKSTKPCSATYAYPLALGHHMRQHYTLQNSYIETLQHILPDIPDNSTIDSWLPLVQNREQWKTLGTEWIKYRQALMIYQYGPHPLLGDEFLHHQFFWHLQDIHRSPILNERWTHVINLSMFFLLCYDLTTILRSRALHRVLSSAIQYA